MISPRMNMNALCNQVIGAELRASAGYSNRYLPAEASITSGLHVPSSAAENTSKQSKVQSLLKRMNSFGKKTDPNGPKENDEFGPKITETVKRKLSLGARILQMGGMEKIFKRLFRVKEGEKLLKAFQCYLSTTAGPIAGILFISSHKIAFCSERSIRIASPKGESFRIHYKVLIPLEKIQRVGESENAKKPSQKYIDVVTVDDFDFWFMGLFYYKTAYKCLQRAISHKLDDEQRLSHF